MNKKYYANRINFVGLYSDKIIICDRKAEYDPDVFWDKTGEFSIDINNLGMHESPNGMFTFSSENKSDVEIWMMGVKSTMKMINRWSQTD
jgi:hypothetical protein